MLKTNPRALLMIGLLSVAACGNVLLAGCAPGYQKESTGQYIDGSVITTNVKARLLHDEYVRGLPITIVTYKNIVQLSGFVNSEAQSLRAEMLARSVPGVAAVENDLVIKRH